MDDDAQLLKSWWEVPCIAHFCSLFRSSFGLTDFDIEELEEAFLNHSVEELASSSLIQELIVRLLKGCFNSHKDEITSSNYQMYLRRLFRQKCNEDPSRKNPFNSDVAFHSLPLRTKVEIIYDLCDFRLDSDEVQDSLKSLESHSLRVKALGKDSGGSTYWYFYGTRLYREDYNTSPTSTPVKRRGKKLLESTQPSTPFGSGSTWQVVCFTEEDWQLLTRKFQNCKSKNEKSLYRTLKEDFLPELPRLFAEKEKLQRKRMMEQQLRRSGRNNNNTTSTSVSGKSGSDEPNNNNNNKNSNNSENNSDDNMSEDELKRKRLEQEEADRLLAEEMQREERKARIHLRERRGGGGGGNSSGSVSSSATPVNSTETTSRSRSNDKSSSSNNKRASASQSSSGKKSSKKTDKANRDRKRMTNNSMAASLPPVKKGSKRDRTRSESPEREEEDEEEEEEEEEDQKEESSRSPSPAPKTPPKTTTTPTKTTSKSKSKPSETSELKEKKEKTSPTNNKVNNSKVNHSSSVSTKPKKKKYDETFKDSNKSSKSGMSKTKVKSSVIFSQFEEDVIIGMHKVIEAMKNHKESWPFIMAVDEDYAPNYYRVISQPMDLQTMEDKLDNHEYKTLEEFKDDFQKIVDNCVKYNGPSSEYTEMVETLQDAFNKSIQRFILPDDSDEEISIEYNTGNDRKRPRVEKVTEHKKENEPRKVKVPTKKAKSEKHEDKKKRKQQLMRHHSRNSEAITELSSATAETLKDINKWLGDNPKISEYSPPSSPNSVSSDKNNVVLRKEEKVEVKKSKKSKLNNNKTPTKTKSKNKSTISGSGDGSAKGKKRKATERVDSSQEEEEDEIDEDEEDEDEEEFKNKKSNVKSTTTNTKTNNKNKKIEKDQGKVKKSRSSKDKISNNNDKESQEQGTTNSSTESKGNKNKDKDKEKEKHHHHRHHRHHRHNQTTPTSSGKERSTSPETTSTTKKTTPPPSSSSTSATSASKTTNSSSSHHQRSSNSKEDKNKKEESSVHSKTTAGSPVRNNSINSTSGKNNPSLIYNQTIGRDSNIDTSNKSEHSSKVKKNEKVKSTKSPVKRGNNGGGNSLIQGLKASGTIKRLQGGGVNKNKFNSNHHHSESKFKSKSGGGGGAGSSSSNANNNALGVYDFVSTSSNYSSKNYLSNSEFSGSGGNSSGGLHSSNSGNRDNTNRDNVTGGVEKKKCLLINDSSNSKEGGPRLSLGSVLTTDAIKLGDFKNKDEVFTDDEDESSSKNGVKNDKFDELKAKVKKTPETEEDEKRSNTNTTTTKTGEEEQGSNKEDEKKEADEKEMENDRKLEPSKGFNRDKCMPNLSAWIKAFGGPKNQQNPNNSATTPTKKPEDPKSKFKVLGRAPPAETFEDRSKHGKSQLSSTKNPPTTPNKSGVIEEPSSQNNNNKQPNSDYSSSNPGGNDEPSHHHHHHHHHQQSGTTSSKKHRNRKMSSSSLSSQSEVGSPYATNQDDISNRINPPRWVGDDHWNHSQSQSPSASSQVSSQSPAGPNSPFSPPMSNQQSPPRTPPWPSAPVRVGFYQEILTSQHSSPEKMSDSNVASPTTPPGQGSGGSSNNNNNNRDGANNNNNNNLNSKNYPAYPNPNYAPRYNNNNTTTTSTGTPSPNVGSNLPSPAPESPHSPITSTNNSSSSSSTNAPSNNSNNNNNNNNNNSNSNTNGPIHPNDYSRLSLTNNPSTSPILHPHHLHLQQQQQQQQQQSFPLQGSQSSKSSPSLEALSSPSVMRSLSRSGPGLSYPITSVNSSGNYMMETNPAHSHSHSPHPENAHVHHHHVSSQGPRFAHSLTPAHHQPVGSLSSSSPGLPSSSSSATITSVPPYTAHSRQGLPPPILSTSTSSSQPQPSPYPSNPYTSNPRSINVAPNVYTNPMAPENSRYYGKPGNSEMNLGPGMIPISSTTTSSSSSSSTSSSSTSSRSRRNAAAAAAAAANNNADSESFSKNSSSNTPSPSVLEAAKLGAELNGGFQWPHNLASLSQIVNSIPNSMAGVPGIPNAYRGHPYDSPVVTAENISKFPRSESASSYTTLTGGGKSSGGTMNSGNSGHSEKSHETNSTTPAPTERRSSSKSESKSSRSKGSNSQPVAGSAFNLSTLPPDLSLYSAKEMSDGSLYSASPPSLAHHHRPDLYPTSSAYTSFAAASAARSTSGVPTASISPYPFIGSHPSPYQPQPVSSQPFAHSQSPRVDPYQPLYNPHVMGLLPPSTPYHGVTPPYPHPHHSLGFNRPGWI